eukprot:jgi/Picre1/30335/NNA_005699.t1
MSKDITATETDEQANDDISAAKVLSSVSNDISSMEDMQDDEVLLGEADATDGLLGLAAEMEGLDVHDEEKPSSSEEKIVRDDDATEKKENDGNEQDANAFHEINSGQSMMSQLMNHSDTPFSLLILCMNSYML